MSLFGSLATFAASVYMCSLPSFVYIITIFIGYSCSTSLKACGRPGRPAKGNLSEFTRVSFPVTFPVGSHVTYKCQENQKLRGWRVRRCQEDGTWSGSIPWCDTNVAFGKNRLVWTNYWVDDTSVTTDGRSSPCFVFDADRVNQHFHFQSFAFYQVTSVVLHIEPRTFQEDRPQLQVGRVLCEPKLQDPPDKKRLVFQCHPPRERINSALEMEKFVEFHLYNSSSISICEVEIYANSDQLECGYPDAPANGRVRVEEFTSYHVAHYSCFEGFRLSFGNPQRLCFGRHWLDVQPTCVPFDPRIATAESSMISETRTEETGRSMTESVLICVLCATGILAVGLTAYTIHYLYLLWRKCVPC